MMAATGKERMIFRKCVTIVTLYWLASSGVRAHICTQSVCEYKWTVRHARSMTYTKDGQAFNVALNGTKLQIVKNSNKKTHKLIGQFVDADDVITTDGRPRNIIVIDDQFPGPIIEVMEGAEVTRSLDLDLLYEI